MDNKCNTVMLYSSQSPIVTEILNRDGICFSKKEYVLKKYQESAPIFMAAYDFFVSEAEKYVPKPEGAEYPYWAFKDLYSLESSGDSSVLQLSVPVDEAIFFDMYDFNKILRLQYIGENDEDEIKFQKMLKDYGMRHESDIILTNFYPDLKRQVQNSWKRLFRHHEKIKAGDTESVGSVQVGLWQIKKDWLVVNFI